ncbi:hypothetical protein QVD17_11034 [Tagetes erecta]|uniref:Uncharacterized protein n=1 Tax=Tagetes erecta TaxID=13708 RepID=A0AAD8P6V8_TARER|nr:hypothetical protein QVD17_11034 [Tagetes erecta]
MMKLYQATGPTLSNGQPLPPPLPPLLHPLPPPHPTTHPHSFSFSLCLLSLSLSASVRHNPAHRRKTNTASRLHFLISIAQSRPHTSYNS